MSKFFLPILPFEIGVYKERNPQLPLNLPFVLNHDSKTGLITEEISDDIKEALMLYYSVGGFGSTPLGEGEYGKGQGEDFFQIIKQILDVTKKTIGEMSFLEIGPGYGYLLYLLKQEGAKEVLGVEPGEEGVTGGKKYNIPVIQDFFPTKLLTKKFDCIFSYCVLEHIENPLFILEEIYKYLNENGIVLIAVPDCQKKLAIGDVSIIAHQHINYFTDSSLKMLIEKAGFSSEQVISSKQRSLLVAWGIKTKSGQNRENNNRRDGQENGLTDERVFKMFANNFQKNIKTIQGLIDKFESGGKTIGLYAACGNLKGLLKFKKEPRVFEGDKVKQGKYMVGCTNVFEPPEKLVLDPVDILFVTAIDYDKEIREHLGKNGLNYQKIKLISLKEIYEKNSGMKYDVGSLLVNQ